MNLQDIYSRIDAQCDLTKEEAITLLEIDNYSNDFYQLLAKANDLSRKEYDNRGYVFAQIGLNSAPCSGNCKFCSLASNHYTIEQEHEKHLTEILEEVQKAVKENVDAVFLMTTADYDLEKYFEISTQVKQLLPEDTMLVANIGDFDVEIAKKLKQIGFSGVYHIVRLNEGIDTELTVEQRIQTLDAIKEVGLDLLYCVEPIGPEHTYEQIAEEMIRARSYQVDIMACMKRVGIKGTPSYEKGEITDLELTKIAAVTRLVTRPKKSMNVHEPKQMTLLAGINQLYAEIGMNPRDLSIDTQSNRGKSVEEMRNMLHQVGYITK